MRKPEDFEPGIYECLASIGTTTITKDNRIEVQNSMLLNSIAVSLKRIADALDPDHKTFNLYDQIKQIAENGKNREEF